MTPSELKAFEDKLFVQTLEVKSQKLAQELADLLVGHDQATALAAAFRLYKHLALANRELNVEIKTIFQ